MGNDGGSIPKRAEMVKTKAKQAQIDDPEEILKAKWTSCFLSKEPLERPVVACGLGRLYNKEAVVKYLLSRESNPEMHHITSLKHIFPVNLTDSNVTESPYFGCPLTGREMNGKCRFVVVRGCGCVFAEQAFRELSADGGKCLVCEKEGQMDIIPLYGKAEEIEELRSKLKKPTKKRPIEDSPSVKPDDKAKALLEEIKSSTSSIATLKKTKGVESIYTSK